MSHGKKLEAVLELLINEEIDQATSLLHTMIIEKARQIYGEIINESDYDMGIDMEEDFGGDTQDDFVDDIKQDKTDIENDEAVGGEEFVDGEEVGDEEGDQSLEDMVYDLESQLDELRAEFDKLVAQEEQEPNHDEEVDGMEFGDSEEVDGEESEGEENMDDADSKKALGEATKFYNEVHVDMKKEGKFAGTGKNSKDSSVGNTTSPVSKSRVDQGGKSTNFSSNKGGAGDQSTSFKKDSCCDNVDVSTSEVKQDSSREGKFVGTGKNSKAGQINKTSLLSKKI